MNKTLQISMIFIICMIMVACNKGDTDVIEDINKHIEATVDIEMQFEENQKEIARLEEKDQEIYDEIIQLGSDDYEEIVMLADEATALLEERSDIVKEEKASVETARKEFEQIKTLIDDIEEKEVEEKVQKMYDAMIARYDAYEGVYDNYMDSIRLTEELYTLLKQEEFQEKQVYSHISDVNDSYEKVTDAFELFNTETNSFNHLKQIYYEYITEKN